MKTDIAKRAVQVFSEVYEKNSAICRDKKPNGITIARTEEVLIVHDTKSQICIQTYDMYSFYVKQNHLLTDNFVYLDNYIIAFKCIKTNNFYEHKLNFIDTFKDDYFSLSTVMEIEVLDMILIAIELRKQFSEKGYTSFCVFGSITDDFISKVQAANNE
ncbi:hypothetical protein XaC1_79 [Xanthomonas phage XaC1]|nr:hypothetical protein XaC1_79 [Xanthomonas phage XaC1]